MRALGAATIRRVCSSRSAAPPFARQTIWQAAKRGLGTITVNDRQSERQLELPYAGCTILTVLEKADMAGRADCRQGKCKKCAVDVNLGEESFEVLSCQEKAVENMTVVLPPNWQPKPRWADPHPEKQRVTTRELKSKENLRAAPACGRQLKEIVRQGNFAFRQRRWEDVEKAIDAIDAALEKHGFSTYCDFAGVSTLARDLVPDFLTALTLSAQAGMGPVPEAIPQKAEELAGHLQRRLEDAGLSAAAFSTSMDDMTIGSHGVGKKGALTEGYDGGAGGLKAGAFFRNFCVWPDMSAS